jgi:hypothetical protein
LAVLKKRCPPIFEKKKERIFGENFIAFQPLLIFPIFLILLKVVIIIHKYI